jgi:large subunit ribosomal protein L25
MAQVITMSALKRERAGKGAARATRREGRVPCVIYGNKQDPVLISIDPAELMRHLRKHGFFSHIFELALDGDKQRVLARDVQFHPVTDRPLHVDFMRFGADTKVHVDVEVAFINDLAAPGLKKGGVLNVVNHTIELICSPENIPEQIVVDLTGKEIGHTIHLSNLTLPANVEAAGEAGLTIATIVAPLTGVVEEGAGAAEGAAAPAEGEAA